MQPCLDLPQLCSTKSSNKIATSRCSRLARSRLDNVLVRPCPDPKFGDYQSNALMALAKARKMNPRQLAADVAAKLDIAQWCEPVEVAGAGFLNFRLKPAAMARRCKAPPAAALCFSKTDRPRCIVIDFSSPNVAKPMHVGHIRSTILGIRLARMLRLLGHRVITDNHIGDWGTQFGKLLVGWKTDLDARGFAGGSHRRDGAALPNDQPRLRERPKSPGSRAPGIGQIAKRRRGKPAHLAGDDRPLRIAVPTRLYPARHQFRLSVWAKVITIRASKRGARIGRARTGPSSEGAMAVFFDDIPELKDHPALVQKSDGGFNYTTTDLATLQFRVEGGTWGAKPDEIIYVTGAPQQLHFQQLFAIFRRWHPEANMKLAHVWFGSVLGEDGKPFKTRAGDTVRLEDLLDEAEERAFKVVSEKNPELSPAEQREIARVVGLGAIKYADLVAEPAKRLHFQLGQNAFPARQHRALSALRLYPCPQHFPQRR